MNFSTLRCEHEEEGKMLLMADSRSTNKQLGRQLESQENITDPVARVTAQSGALRNGILLQNLGAYFLELGRTVTTMRLGISPAEVIVNAGPAVFISSSGTNPIIVQEGCCILFLGDIQVYLLGI